MTRFFLLVLLCAVGCSPNRSLEGAGGTFDTAASDSADDTGEMDDDTGPSIEPAWYVVRADLTVADGLPVPDGAELSIDVVDADLERTDCVVELDPSGLAAATVDGAEPGSLWWELPVVPTTASCATLPTTLTLGVGSLDPDVRARLGTVHLDAVADSLFGAYFLLDGAITAYGYAGTANDLFGDDLAALPPPDGLYRLAPLYLAPLPE